MHSPECDDGGVDFGLSTLVPVKWPHAVGIREQLTEIRPLDEIIPEALSDERVGFIKVDVERYELKFFKDGRNSETKSARVYWSRLRTFKRPAN